MNRLRFAKYREVKSPRRANKGDAGIDFFIPSDLTPDQIIEANSKTDVQINGIRSDVPNTLNWARFAINEKDKVVALALDPGTRIIIPSGIKLLIEPMDSMLMAANKSGIATKQGLIYTAEVVDSPYVGEVHLGIANITEKRQVINFEKAVLQFIHVPIYLTDLEEIEPDEYESISDTWGERGENWQGSSDHQAPEDDTNESYI